MNVLVVSDAHIMKSKDGKYWCNTAVHGYDFWKRYLDVFDNVHVVARVKYLDSKEEKNYIRADGDRVTIVELPFIRGFKEYVFNFLLFTKEVKKAIHNEETAIFRVPSLPAYILLYFFKKLKRPYAFEVVADPINVYQSNKIAQKLLTFITKKECRKANGVSYVTKFFLQNYYPCKALYQKNDENYFTSYYSSIDLDDSFFYQKRIYRKLDSIRLVHVASTINLDTKGHTTLIKIVEQLKKDGLKVTLKCLGEGDKVPYYKKIIREKGLEDEIEFIGLFTSKKDLRDLLLESDIFVFPTKAEGLPRALIEAMATGLPCLSTYVNGIPELLENKYLFDPLDVNGFVKKIEFLIKNPDELSYMSEENINKAKKYRSEILKERRNIFYRKLRKLAEK